MTLRFLLMEYLAAYNEHNVDKIASFLHPDCRVIYNGQLVIQDAAAMKPTYEKDFLDSQAYATMVEYHEDINTEDRARLLLKTHDHRLIDVTYVFDTKSNECNVNNNKMIEHIIHSVNYE